MRTMDLLRLVLIVSIAFEMRSIVRAEVFSTEENTLITTFVDNAMDCRKFPGLMLSVVKGEGTWLRGYGTADLDTGRMVDETTQFTIGSVGKGFTAALLGIVLKETRYNWFTRLSDIDGLNLQFVDEELTRNVTLADLLSHATGLSSVADNGFIAGYPDGADRAFLSQRLEYLPSVLPLRTSFIYNNMMYLVIGHVIEVLGGDTYASLLETRLLRPLDMRSSQILRSSDDVQTGNVAKPIVYRDGVMQEGTYNLYKMYPLEPAGAILSNAGDMAKWMRFNLRQGVTDSGEILIDEETYSQVFQSHNTYATLGTISEPVNDTADGYGFGWFRANYRGFVKSWHSGGLFSYVSYLWLFPERDIGIFCNINGPGLLSTPGDGIRAIMYYISDLLLGLEPWQTPQTGCTFPAPWVNDTDWGLVNEEPGPMPVDIAQYEGTYGNELLPDITLYKQDGGFILDWNRIKGILRAKANTVDTFMLEITEPWEYALEKYIGTFQILNEVKFKRENISETENEVISFEIGLQSRMTFSKDVRLLPMPDNSGAWQIIVYYKLTSMIPWLLFIFMF